MITYANGLKRVETIDELQRVITPKAFAHAFDGKFSYPHWCNKYHTNGYKLVAKTHRLAYGMKATFLQLGFNIE